MIINATKRLQRFDPTRTGTMMRAHLVKVRRAFARLKGEIVRFLVKEDGLGLRSNIVRVGNALTVNPFVSEAQRWACRAKDDPNWDCDEWESKTPDKLPKRKRMVVVNADPKFASNPEKVKEFHEWLKKQLGEIVAGKTERELWEAYIEAGFKKGMGRSFDDSSDLPLGESLDFYKGTKDEFLRGAFGTPVSVEKVKMLAGRTFTDLENVTADMATKMTRVLVDGLIAGSTPEEIADLLAKEIGISLVRAEAIARTEIIRAHAEGQLDALERLGVDEIGVAVEWSTAGVYCRTKKDKKHGGCVCAACKPLEGIVLKVSEAHGLIPRHPNAVFAGSTYVPYGEVKEFVRAWYSGPSVVLAFDGRKDRTTIGPNHPMMTRRGMVPAAQLREGDEVLYDLRHDSLGRSVQVLDINHEKVPLVENAFEACLSVDAGISVAISSSDLHGDRIHCKGEVNAVVPARGLLLILDSCGVEEFREHGFPRPNSNALREPGFSSSRLDFNRVDLSPARDVRGGNLLGTARLRHPRPLDGLGLALTSRSYASSDDAEANRPTAHAVPLGQDVLGVSRQVAVNDFFVWKRVHAVSFGKYEGYAFDCTTDSSLYCSGGFVVSNCRCAFIPANIGGESPGGTKETKGKIDRAMRESRKNMGDDWAIGVEIDKDRPEPPLLNFRRIDPRLLAAFEGARNSFCPTGPGGGKDPTCSPGGGKGADKPSLLKSLWTRVKMAFGGGSPKVDADVKGPSPIKAKSNVFHVDKAREKLAGAGVKDMWGTDLSKSADLRALAVRDPHAFDKTLVNVEHSFRSAAKFGATPKQKAAIAGKLRELSDLKRAVLDFRAKKMPETVSEDDVHVFKQYGKKGQGKKTVAAAMEHLSKGGDVVSATKHVKDTFGVSDSTARRYVRAAVKEAAKSAADRVAKLKKEVSRAA